MDWRSQPRDNLAEQGGGMSSEGRGLRGATGSAFASIASADAKRVLRFLSDAEDLGADDPFPKVFLEQLGRLIPAGWIGYEERDFVGRRCIAQHEHTDVAPGGSIDFDLRADPVVRHLLDGHFKAIRLSDLVPQRILQRTQYYEQVLRPLGITDSLGMAIPSPPSHSKRFILDRHDRYFSTRDRTVLQCLQPHFEHLWCAARTRRRLRAAIAGLESASEQDTRGVILLASAASVEFASRPAQRLTREYFGAPLETQLPDALSAWFESGTPTLRLRQDDRHLTVSRSGDALLLEEGRDQLGLTPREREILAWVSRGRTNSEIAEALWIAPTTVRKISRTPLPSSAFALAPAPSPASSAPRVTRLRHRTMFV
jgi:Bacterial regulatory proteins, luxR family